MIAFLVILLFAGFVLEVYSLNTSFQNIDFEFAPETKSTEPDTVFWISQKITNNGRMPISYIRTKILYPKGVKNKKDAAIIQNRFEREQTQRYFIWGSRSIRRRTPAKLSERGLYWFEGAELERGDFLGLKTSYDMRWGYSGIVVYPKILEEAENRQTLSGIVGDLISRPYLLNDPVLARGMNDYTGNEPMKTISWKQTAKRDKLTVREFEYTRDCACSLIVCSDVSASEEEIEMCARLARTTGELLMEEGVSLSFFTNCYLQGTQPFSVYSARASRGSADVFLDQLARIRDGACASQSLLLDEILRGRREQTEYVVIIPSHGSEAEGFAEKLNTAANAQCVMICAQDWMDNI